MSSLVVTPARPRAPRALERGAREARRLRSALSTRVYLPACSVAIAAALLLAFGWATGWGGADFAGSVTSLRAVVAGPVTLAIIGIFLVAERVRPAQRRSLFARGHRHDLIFAAMNATILVPLVTGLTLAFVAVLRSAVPWIVLPQIGHASVTALVLLAVGGVIYSAGAIFYATHWPNPWPRTFGHHEFFHACTLVAAICHHVAIYFAVFA